MKKLLFSLIALSFLNLNAQNQTIGLNYSFGFNPDNNNFTYNGASLGNYALGWYSITGGAEARLSGYGGIHLFTNKLNRLSIIHNGNVGIGTDNPNLKLHIKNPNGGAALGIERGDKLWRFDIQHTGNKLLLGNTDAPSFFEFDNSGAFTVTAQHSTLEKAYVTVKGKKEDGSGIVSGSLISGNADNAKFNLFNVGLESWYGIGFRSSFNNKVGIIFNTRTASAFFEGNIGIGTDNPGSWKLAVNGQIRAKEIKVETGWSDFVFQSNYLLPNLTEVENHIKEKGHLKDIPSAKEVAENGIFLGEMDSKLLQKIEELTLYTIQQQKEIIEQKEKVEKQAKEIEFLKSLTSDLVSLKADIEKLKSK